MFEAAGNTAARVGADMVRAVLWGAFWIDMLYNSCLVAAKRSRGRSHGSRAVGGRSVGRRAFGGRLGEAALARAEEQAAHSGAVPGDQRVEIAAAVTDTLGGGGKTQPRAKPR